MSENWHQNDPNYHYNLRVAMTVQDVLIELKDLLKLKKDTIQNLQKTNDPRLTFADFQEEQRIVKQIKDFEGKFNPFTIVNNDPNLLSY